MCSLPNAHLTRFWIIYATNNWGEVGGGGALGARKTLGSLYLNGCPCKLVRFKKKTFGFFARPAIVSAITKCPCQTCVRRPEDQKTLLRGRDLGKSRSTGACACDPLSNAFYAEFGQCNRNQRILWVRSTWLNAWRMNSRSYEIYSHFE